MQQCSCFFENVWYTWNIFEYCLDYLNRIQNIKNVEKLLFVKHANCSFDANAQLILMGRQSGMLLCVRLRQVPYIQIPFVFFGRLLPLFCLHCGHVFAQSQHLLASKLWMIGQRCWMMLCSSIYGTWFGMLSDLAKKLLLHCLCCRSALALLVWTKCGEQEIWPIDWLISIMVLRCWA